MKEIEAEAGTHISRACEALAGAGEPAFLEFNEIRLEWRPSVTAGDLAAEYDEKSAARYEAAQATRRAYEETPQGRREVEAARRAQTDKKRRQLEALTMIETTRLKYPWPDIAGEISGFGGGYEAACRNMLYAGLRLLDENPDAPDDELEEAILAVEPECSGAMFGAARGAARFIAREGWGEYVNRMTRDPE